MVSPSAQPDQRGRLRVDSVPVGSSGQRRRKPKHTQPHTSAQMHESHLHAEQDAVLGNMGLGSSAQWIKVVAVVLIVALVVGALGSLLLLAIR